MGQKRGFALYRGAHYTGQHAVACRSDCRLTCRVHCARPGPSPRPLLCCPLQWSGWAARRADPKLESQAEPASSHLKGTSPGGCLTRPRPPGHGTWGLGWAHKEIHFKGVSLSFPDKKSGPTRQAPQGRARRERRVSSLWLPDGCGYGGSKANSESWEAGVGPPWTFYPGGIIRPAGLRGGLQPPGRATCRPGLSICDRVTRPREQMGGGLGNLCDGGPEPPAGTLALL